MLKLIMPIKKYLKQTGKKKSKIKLYWTVKRPVMEHMPTKLGFCKNV